MPETIPQTASAIHFLGVVPVLGGATASGKSALALRLAETFELEVVSADAMMVYRKLDIGTAKPTPEERARVPHHLIDVAEPDKRFSVARYVRLAEAAIAEVLARGKLPLVVGGTGFYIRALTQGLPTTPEADPEAQRPLWRRFEREGLAGLERDLYALSPGDADRAQRNPRRVIRALEVWQRSGRSPADFPLAQPRYRYSKRRLEPAPDVLERAVAERTEEMFAAGLVGEVERLLRHYPGATTALQAIGYKEVQAALSGKITVTAAKDAVTQATLRYAKRQRTWFHKEPGMQPLRAAEAAAWLAGLAEACHAHDP
jgi:tRNA dimethylallyltransferase